MAGTLGICLTSLTQDPEASNEPQADSDDHEIENQREDSESDGSSNDCDTSGDNEPIHKSDDSDTDIETANYETRTNDMGMKLVFGTIENARII